MEKSGKKLRELVEKKKKPHVRTHRGGRRIVVKMR